MFRYVVICLFVIGYLCLTDTNRNEALNKSNSEKCVRALHDLNLITQNPLGLDLIMRIIIASILQAIVNDL